ncbi:hypothetical protein GCM10010103_07780 [Streptomyces paradoxus]
MPPTRLRSQAEVRPAQVCVRPVEETEQGTGTGTPRRVGAPLTARLEQVLSARAGEIGGSPW